LFARKWKDKHNPPETDAWPQLTRREQTAIFRLRTGHCRLLEHQYRIGISHTPECLFGNGLQNAETFYNTVQSSRRHEIKSMEESSSLRVVSSQDFLQPDTEEECWNIVQKRLSAVGLAALLGHLYIRR
jgi:hypothetical protein